MIKFKFKNVIYINYITIQRNFNKKNQNINALIKLIFN